MQLWESLDCCRTRGGSSALTLTLPTLQYGDILCDDNENFSHQTKDGNKWSTMNAPIIPYLAGQAYCAKHTAAAYISFPRY